LREFRKKILLNCPQGEYKKVQFCPVSKTVHIDKKNFFHIKMVSWGKFLGHFFMQELQYAPFFKSAKNCASFDTFCGQFLEKIYSTHRKG
jgi:hypothetical protein